MMLSLKHFVPAILVLCFIACTVTAQYGVQSVAFHFNVFKEITWPKDVVRGPKVCNATRIKLGDSFTISAEKCIDGNNTFNNICVFLRESSQSNEGVLNCDFSHATSISELIRVEPFDDGNPFSGDLIIPTRNHGYRPSILANTMSIKDTSNNYKTETIGNAQILFRDQNRSSVIALLKDKSLYVFEDYMRKAAINATIGTVYTICDANGFSRFEYINQIIHPIGCPPDDVFCKTLIKITNKIYDNGVHTLLNYPDMSIVSLVLGFELIGVSENPATCKFKSMRNDIFCFDKTKSASLIQCKNGQWCEAGLLCRSKNLLRGRKLTMGDISIYKDRNVIVMRSQKTHGFVRDSLLISQSVDGTVGIADKHGHLNAFISNGHINSIDRSEPRFTNPNPLMCFENMNNIRICTPDASITNDTKFNKMEESVYTTQHFHVLVNGKHAMFNHNLQAVGDGIQIKTGSVWQGDNTLLAANINGTFYTTLNVTRHNLCPNQNPTNVPEYIQGTGIFYQICGNSKVALFDGNTKRLLTKESYLQSETVLLHHHNIKAWNPTRIFQSGSKSSLEKYYATYTNASDCQKLQNGEKALVTLKNGLTEVAKCYKVDKTTLIFDASLETNDWLQLCKDDLVIDAGSNYVRDNSNICLTFVPAAFAFLRDNAFTLSYLCIDTHYQSFLPNFDLNVVSTSDPNVTIIRHVGNGESIAICKNNKLYSYGKRHLASDIKQSVGRLEYQNWHIKDALKDCRVSQNFVETAVGSYYLNSGIFELVSNGLTLLVTDTGFSVTCGSEINDETREGLAAIAAYTGTDIHTLIESRDPSRNIDKCIYDTKYSKEC